MTAVADRATAMLEAVRCVETLNDDTVDDAEHNRCALATRNILAYLRENAAFR